MKSTCYTPPRKHRQSRLQLTLNLILSIPFIFCSTESFAQDHIFDKNNPWSSPQSFSSGSLNENNSYKIVDQGIDTSIKNLYFFDTTDGDNITVNQNTYEIASTNTNLNNFTAIQFKDSQNITLHNNTINTGSGKYSNSITGINFLTSQQFPWDPSADQCLGISIKNNEMTVNSDTESKFITMVKTSQVAGDISENHLYVNGGTFTEIKGVSSSKIDDTKGTLDISNNEITVIDSTFRGVYGVYSNGDWTGNIKGTKLYLKGTNTLTDRYEGIVIHAQEAGGSHTIRESLQTPLSEALLDITGTLNINKGSSLSIAASHSSWAPVESNQVYLHDLDLNINTDRTIPMYVYGGYSQSNSSNNNQIKIEQVLSNSNKRINFYAGYSDPDDNFASATTVQNNHIEVSNSTLNSTSLIAAFNSWGECKDASITIKNSTIGGIISPFKGSGKLNQSFSNGTIEIIGKNDLSNASLKPIDFYSENIQNTSLILNGFSGTINQLGYVLPSTNGTKYISFDKIIFKNQTWSNGSTLLKIEPYTVYGQPIAKASFNENSLAFTNPQDIKPGQTMTIVQYQALGDEEAHLVYTDDEALPDEFTLQTTAGTGNVLDGTIRFGDDSITYTIAGSEQSEQTVLVGDSRLAASAFVNQGSDLLERVFHGFTLSRDKYGLMTFATAEGTKGQYDLSSPIKLNGWNFLGGVRYVTPTAYGDLTGAAFFEYGDANYRTSNSHLNLDFRTDGSVRYIGGGIAMRLMTPANFYAEGSLRAGQLRSDLDRALMDANGNFYDADTHSLYAGVHLGAGYIFKPTSSLELDSYAKYFFSYTDSDDFRIDQYNETYEFESITSHRLRLGTRLSTRQDNITFMIGLAGEYEFDGESDMVVANAATRTSDLGGFSAFAEAGFSITPSAGSPWQFDAQVRGWEGNRDAVSGMVTVNYLF